MANGRGGKGSVLLLVAVLFVIQLATWRGSSRARDLYERDLETKGLHKRSYLDAEAPLDALKKHEKDGKHKHDKSDKKKHSTTHTSTSHASTTTASTITLTSSTLASKPTHTPACRPLPTDEMPEQVCDHVRKYCPPSGHLNYLEFFYCIGLDVPYTSASTPLITAAPSLQIARDDDTQHGSHNVTTRVELLRVVALLTIIVWMLFLFSWVGIVASDFFCPNLSTLAARLGLSESTAGVTFLAFGNGSPDVFSTFGAMRSGSGSLAIGELIGAASFIVSVISGSMMLIAPFRVKRYPFLRDVGFFTVAVALTLSFLFDGKLRFAECISLIALYLLYATTVIIGSWWQERRRAQRQRMASIRSEHSVSEAGQGTFLSDDGGHSDNDVDASRLRGSPYLPPMSAIEYEPEVDPFASWAEATSTATDGGRLTPRSAISPGPSSLVTAVELPSSSSGNASAARLQRFRSGVLARHSLLGAVEFRDVVQNLRKGSSVDKTMEVFRSRDPERYLPHPQHAHQHQHQQEIDRTGRDSKLIDSPGRRHSRTKSMTRPRTRRFLSQAETGVVNSLVRSRSTIGSAAHEGPMADVERPTLEQIGRSSKLAAAVDDPWREHNADDGCEANTLPPPAIPLAGEEGPSGTDSDSADQSMRKTKPALPRLIVRQATAPPRDADDFFSPTSKPGMRRRSVQITQSPAEMLLRSANSRQTFRRTFRSTVRALFPSLRHLREKSWLGLFIGAVTAPAILMLNLTLPVVDDEAEKALMAGEKEGTGQIRLEGEDTAIRAYPRSILSADNDASSDEEEDGDEGRGTILLDGASGDNPWDTSETQKTNARANLQVGSALRHLQQDVSPVLPTRQSGGMAAVAATDVHIDDAQSTSSEDTCHSDSSHVETRLSRTLLGIAQCAFAPAFCTWAITSSAESKHVLVKTVFALLGGTVLAIFALLVTVKLERREEGCPPGLLKTVGWTRVAVGFFVSVLYIMSIVDEVVSILQTLGLVLGLSDAILGLTVFAMGNSLGDLVANITIARMGHPVMAISACFAGPLLNLLLGIGFSGSYLLSGHSSGQGTISAADFDALRHVKPHVKDGIYHIDFSPTLTVSGCGLLFILVGTMIAVPMNNFYLDRKIGLSLICTYAVIMCINIAVEVYNLQG